MDFNKLKKAELIQLLTVMDQENKEMKKALGGLKKNADKPFIAYSAGTINGKNYLLEVPFNKDMAVMIEYPNFKRAVYEAQTAFSDQIFKNPITIKEE
jgi:hypothetical protein